LIESAANPTAVFASYGLCSKGGWGASIPIDENGPVDIPLLLCKALVQVGGLYAVFGRFLSWRADLLDATCLGYLRQVQAEYPPIALSAVASIVRRELGPSGLDLAAGLEGPALWSTLSRTAYLSRFRGQLIVVQVARDCVGLEHFIEFEHAMRAVRHPATVDIVSSVVIAQFRQWVRNGESLAKEKSFLDVLGHHQGETLVAYPVPIPELSNSSVLCWLAVEGRTASQLLSQGDPEIAVLIASAILEQFYSLSMVDADLDPEAMIVDRNHRLHFRRLNNPIAVPASLVDNGIKYTSAVLAGNASVSAQTLIRLMVSRPPLDLEKQLIDEFSGVEPELKINRWFPQSAGAFESNWRALARLKPTRPLFLDCLHRNLVAAGYWNSDAVGAGAPVVDAIAEAQSPVVGRLIRTQFGMLLNKETAVEWLLGSGLLVFGAFREMNRMAEELRDNDLTVGVASMEPAQPPVGKNRLSGVVVLACLLCILLMSLFWGATAPAPWHTVLRFLAVGSLPAMFWAVWRIG